MARILVLRQSYYPFDPRLRPETLALEAAGHDVEILCLRQPGARAVERMGRILVRRLPMAKARGSSKLRYLFQYMAFMVLAAAWTSVLHLRHRFDLVQVNSIPDWLVFAAVVPKLTGTPILLDLQETLPEFFASKFKVPMNSRIVRGVAVLEQLSIRFASFVITCTEHMKGAFVARGATAEKIAVIMVSTDEQLFDYTRYRPHRDARYMTLICHGSVEERYGLDTAIEAVAILKDQIPGLRLKILGEGSYLVNLRLIAEKRGVSDRVHFSDGFVPLPELLQAIADSDFGVVAMKRDVFRDLTHCLKMFDFIAMRRPALVSRTRAVTDYFGEDTFQMFESDNATDLARAILALKADPGRGDRLVERVVEVSEPYRWHHQRARYQKIVSSLLAGRFPHVEPQGLPRFEKWADGAVGDHEALATA